MSAAAYADCMRFAYGGIRGVGRGSRPRVGPSRRLNRAPGGASRAPGGGLTPKCCVPTRGLTREAPGVPEGEGVLGLQPHPQAVFSDSVSPITVPRAASQVLPPSSERFTIHMRGVAFMLRPPTKG